MATVRLVIPAAGIGVRWRHYHAQREAFEEAGFTKHFLQLAGETIIGRQIRLFRERGVTDIWVVGPDDRYRLPGTTLFIPVQVPDHHDANKVLNSSELWEGRTIVLYGDVFLTDEAADQILADDRDWFAFGRWARHRCTDGPEELFGFVFDPAWFDHNRRTLVNIAALKRQGVLQRCAGWEFYWAHNGDPKTQRVYAGNWLEIDDMSDDVDTPEQYEAMVRCVGRS